MLLPVVAALNGLGLAVIHRLDLAYEAADRTAGFAQKQLTWMTLGVALFVATLVFLRDHRALQRVTYTLGLTAIVLLLLPMVPGLGTTINGARIWIRLGAFSFQPGEVAKVLLVVAFAGYLVLHRDALALAGRRLLFVDLPRGRDLGPILVMWLLSLAILVFQRDLGSSLLFFGLFLVMLYVSTERPGWLVVGGGLFVGGGLLAWQLFTHVQARVDIWLDPFDHYGEGTDDTAFQPVEAMFGMGWGGLIGRGFGDGSPDRVPFANSDFIVASIGEELGAHRRDRRDPDVRHHGRTRAPGRAGLPRRLRKADRHRVGRGPRAPGLRRHRRRHRVDPPHRTDHSVPVLRRLVPGRELGDHRPAAPDLRPGPPAGALARARGRAARQRDHPGGEAVKASTKRATGRCSTTGFLSIGVAPRGDAR